MRSLTVPLEWNTIRGWTDGCTFKSHLPNQSTFIIQKSGRHHRNTPLRWQTFIWIITTIIKNLWHSILLMQFARNRLVVHIRSCIYHCIGCSKQFLRKLYPTPKIEGVTSRWKSSSLEYRSKTCSGEELPITPAALAGSIVHAKSVVLRIYIACSALFHTATRRRYVEQSNTAEMQHTVPQWVADAMRSVTCMIVWHAVSVRKW